MERIGEAAAVVPRVALRRSQRTACEPTFPELGAIDAVDNEDSQTIADWVVERIREKEALPGSRAVRRQAAQFCREQGHEIRNEEWLGI